MGLIVKQLNHLHCYSYLVWDSETKQTLIVDPVLELFDLFVQFIEEHQLKTTTIVDTHTHSDHFSGSLALKQILGGTIRLSEHSLSLRQEKPLKNQESFYLGLNPVRVILIPGHTRDSLILLTQDFVLTGDTVLIQDMGRIDDELSIPEKLVQGIQNELLNLKCDTLLYPGHDYHKRLFSTIGKEKRFISEELNYRSQQILSQEDSQSIKHIKFFNCSLQEYPEHKQENVILCCSNIIDCKQPFQGQSISVKQASQKPEQIIDIREDFELQLHQIPGVKHIPISSLGQYYSTMSSQQPIAFLCNSGHRSQIAQQTFAYLGINARNITGGIQAWCHAGLPTI